MKKLLLLVTLLPLYAGAMNQQYLDEQLLQAAQEGSVHQVYQLLKAGANKDAKNQYGSTPLHDAAFNGNTDIVKLLLEKGASINATSYDDTPLHLAALWGNTDAAKLLLEAGADKDAVNNDGYTPLHWAAQSGKTNVAKLLLAVGADKDDADSCGETPLHRAALYGKTDIVRLLLSYGADPLIKTKQVIKTKQGKTPPLITLLNPLDTPKKIEGKTPLDMTQPESWDESEVIENKKIIAPMLTQYQQLLQEINTNPTHETLTKAVEHGYALLVKQLLLKLKPTESQISTLGIIAKNNGHNKIGQMLKDYAHALSLQHQMLIPQKLPVEIAHVIAGYTL